MGTTTKHSSGLAASLRRPEQVLLAVVWAGFALILVTPFIVTPETIFPFVVGKALFSRTLIEIVVGCWALLALFNPAYRPPRSRLLILLAVVLGISVLAACFGVSMQRSLWSNYERMQGLVDQAHWFALAVVLVSVVRTPSQWRLLLNLNLGGGLAMALLVIALNHGVRLPFYSDILVIYPDIPATQRPPPGFDMDRRALGTLGNSTYLSAYMLVHLVVAVGFLARSFVPAAPTAPAPLPEKRGKRRRQQVPPAGKNSPDMLWAARLFWGTTALLSLWVLFLSGSLGGLAGLGMALAFLAAAYSYLAHSRPVQRVADGATGFLSCAILLALILSLPFGDLRSSSNVLLKRLGKMVASRVGSYENAPKRTAAESASARIVAWESGLAGFADRPLLGWGPENFIVVFGRYIKGEVDIEIHDYAHAKLVEVLATTGTLGLLGYLALWGFLFYAALRAAKGAESKDQTLILFVGAALAGYFVQKQVLFDTTTGSLQYILLLAFVANLEAQNSREKSWIRLSISSRIDRLGRKVAVGHWARAVLALAAVGLVGVGLNANHSIHSTASGLNEIMSVEDQTIDQVVEHFEWLTAEFEPLANLPRTLLFENVVLQWQRIYMHRNEAKKLLALVDAQAAQAVRSEPENWLIHGALAELYETVAATNPEYQEYWMSHRKKSRVLIDSADYTVYWSQNSLLYVNKGTNGCGEEPKGEAPDVQFFVHVYPANANVLQGDRFKYGFDSFDFLFWRDGFEISGQCLYRVEFPAYAIDHIRTGQYVPGAGRLSDKRLNFRNFFRR